MSLLQLPYIQKLIDDDRVDEVDIIAVDAISKEREKMGWYVDINNDSDQCRYYVHPDDVQIRELFAKDVEDCIHFFAGIRAYPYVFHAFKMSLNYQIRRGIITERPYTYAFGRKNGKPLWLHRIRAYIQDRKYYHSIDYVFGFGEEAVRYYCSLYSKWKVFSFAYCTKQPDILISKQLENEKVRFLFVGSLSRRKNPDLIIRSAQKLNEQVVVDFIGNGKMEKKMKAMVGKNTSRCKFNLLGVKGNQEIHHIMDGYDVLILPSVHDGWGAVVNEALQTGLYVIISDCCGAKELVGSTSRGVIFKQGDQISLCDAMMKTISNIKQIRAQKDSRRAWAVNHISGSVIAKYMIDCIKGVQSVAPWI